ncbi:STAS domain-containing protein [Streptomyces sp. UC4497]
MFERGDRTAVAVYGEIDFDVAPGFDDALRTAVARSISGLDLELGAMTFCDGAGLRVLLRARRAALEAEKTVRLCSASPPVERLLRITRTHGLFAGDIGLESAPGRPSGTREA